jgi:hypothetical protein
MKRKLIFLIKLLLGLVVAGLLGGFVYAAHMLLVKTWDVTDAVVAGESGSLTDPLARATLIDLQYGPVPPLRDDWEITKTVLDATAYNDTASIERWDMSLPHSDVALTVVVIIPHRVEVQPALVVSNFCPNHVRYGAYNLPKPKFYFSMCEEDSMTSGWFVNATFGEYIAMYPYQKFIDQGLILANVYLAEVAADDAVAAMADLEVLREATGVPVTGTIAAWAFAYQAVNHALEADSRVQADQTGIYGHSRDGKAALLAAALDERIDLTIAHQSGKGGAALWQRKVGESKTAIMENYPHWFAPTFGIADEIGTTLDQHLLIAGVAPRPLLLSAAWLDNWGDPAGVLLAAKAATPAYTEAGATGITTGVLSDAFSPTHELTFFIRPYTHGVRPADWDAFFAFIDIHFDLVPNTN